MNFVQLTFFLNHHILCLLLICNPSSFSGNPVRFRDCPVAVSRGGGWALRVRDPGSSPHAWCGKWLERAWGVWVETGKLIRFAATPHFCSFGYLTKCFPGFSLVESTP